MADLQLWQQEALGIPLTLSAAGNKRKCYYITGRQNEQNDIIGSLSGDLSSFFEL